MISLFIAIPGWKLLRSLGGVGLVILGVVDSSVVPTFGSLDALTAILAVKNHELWPYYAAASTAGNCGAQRTYRLQPSMQRGPWKRPEPCSTYRLKIAFSLNVQSGSVSPEQLAIS